MAEIIDVLMHRGDNSAFFQTNTAVQFVLLQAPVNEYLGFTVLENAAGDYLFQNGDNILILSMGFYLPLGFELYESDAGGEFFHPHIITLLKQNPSGAILGLLPKTYMPLGNNYELSIGNWHEIIDVSPDSAFDMWAALPFQNPIQLKISMVGVPDELAEQTFHVPVFIKVSHTLPLVEA